MEVFVLPTYDLPPPRDGRRFDRFGCVKFNAEISVGSYHFIGEDFIRAVDFYGPYIVIRHRDIRTVEHILCRLIRREGDTRGGDGRSCAAVIGHRIAAAVMMSMIVAEGEGVVLITEYPCTRAVFTDVKRDFDVVISAVAYMHDNPFLAPRVIGGVRCDDLAEVGLAAGLAQLTEEGTVSCSANSARSKESGYSKGQYIRLAHRLLHACCDEINIANVKDEADEDGDEKERSPEHEGFVIEARRVDICRRYGGAGAWG